MPDSCSECRFKDYVFTTGVTWCVANCVVLARNFEAIKFDGRPDWCPLVDLGKHGDLIDRDKVIPKLNFINEAEHQIYRSASWGFTAKCIHALDDAPTVIEAEDE
jgi:hypothetical protein